MDIVNVPSTPMSEESGNCHSIITNHRRRTALKHLEKERRHYQHCCHYRKVSIEIKPQIAALEQSIQNAEFRKYRAVFDK